jgi:hypothetical protein
LNVSFIMDNLIKLRKDLFEKTKIKISINDYLIKAVKLALKVFPRNYYPLTISKLGPNPRIPGEILVKLYFEYRLRFVL